MLKHIALYNFKKEMDASDKKVAAVKLKKGFEGLRDKIDGLVSISVEIILLETSTADFLLKAKFTDKDALERFNNSPLLFNVRSELDKMEVIHTADYVV
ncbi:MAG: Dabb family protein [Oscillospiraceae bacterium]|nr:Dabb family protein [Oscillospiraceae bacterium]